MPGITIGDTVPNLEVETTHGKMKLCDYIDDSWTILFSHPSDFTPVCTTELGMMATYESEFSKRGAKLIALSYDNVQSHNEWIKDIEAYTPGCKVSYPIIADPNREIMEQLNMVEPASFSGSAHCRPDKKVKQHLADVIANRLKFVN